MGKQTWWKTVDDVEWIWSIQSVNKLLQRLRPHLLIAVIGVVSHRKEMGHHVVGVSQRQKTLLERLTKI